MKRALEVQGHRGARGLKPENTLPSFEIALDLGVSSLETDLHLTADDVPIIFHDFAITPRLCSAAHSDIALASLTRAQLRPFRIDRNPAPALFPAQDPTATPLAATFAADIGLDPFGIPTLTELFAFVTAYAGVPGRRAGKTPDQQAKAARVLFDLEIKRIPFFAAAATGQLEQQTVASIRQHGLVKRARLRSFDHRSVRFVKSLEPGVQVAVLIARTAPVDPAGLVEAADADVYCPDFQFLDAELVWEIQQAGKRVIPWTVNQPAAWERLAAWDVDGITTDYPDRLLAWLAARGLAAM